MNRYIIIIIILIILLLLIIVYNNNIYEGYTNNLKEYNVIFGGTIRDVGPYLKRNLDHIDRCGEKFNSYELILYENDSNDDTRQILEEYKKPNYHYIIENDISEPLRTVRISNGRNKLLEKVKELNVNNKYQYFIMLDMDNVNNTGKFVDTIDTCFTDLNWDVLTANQSDAYYDMWALRKKGLLDWDCWKEHKKAVANGMDHGESMKKYIYVMDKFETGQRIDVDSAFSGIAIYKISSIGDCVYNGKHDDGDELCEHVPFHKCIKANGGSIYINTDFLTN